MYYLTVIDTNGGYSPTVTSEKVPDYKTIKAGISGALLELVPHFDKYGDKPCVAFCDEEGKLKRLDTNAKATYLWYACLAPEPFRPDVINGPIVIVSADTATELQEI